MLLLFGGWPPRVVTDEGAKLKLDSGAVVFGVLGEAFERVNAADADVSVLTAELLDRLGVTLGHLPLLSEFEGTKC